MTGATIEQTASETAERVAEAVEDTILETLEDLSPRDEKLVEQVANELRDVLEEVVYTQLTNQSDPAKDVLVIVQEYLEDLMQGDTEPVIKEVRNVLANTLQKKVALKEEPAKMEEAEEKPMVAEPTVEEKSVEEAEEKPTEEEEGKEEELLIEPFALTTEMSDAELLETMLANIKPDASTRAKARWLAENVPGIKVGRIAKMLEKRYQQVYGALSEAGLLPQGGFKCSICGKTLSAPASIAEGIGPVCAHKGKGAA